MSIKRRIMNILSGIFMLVCAAVLITHPDYGYIFVAAVLSITLFLYGVKLLGYYWGMARHMVGGRRILYQGIIFFDLGIFAMAIPMAPHSMILLYLVGMQLFGGAIDILKFRETVKMGGSAWKLPLSQGMLSVVLAACCLLFFGNNTLLVALYCVSLVYSAVIRILEAFRRTPIVYIQ